MKIKSEPLQGSGGEGGTPEGVQDTSKSESVHPGMEMNDTKIEGRRGDGSTGSVPVSPNQVAPQAPNNQSGGVKRTQGAARVKKTRARGKAAEPKKQLTSQEQQAKQRKERWIRRAIGGAGLIGFCVAGALTGGIGFFIGGVVWLALSLNVTKENIKKMKGLSAPL